MQIEQVEHCTYYTCPPPRPPNTVTEVKRDVLHGIILPHDISGVAFEQGKILPTPETVPFRLTRDIIDGMGVAGVEGAFRR